MEISKDLNQLCIESIMSHLSIESFVSYCLLTQISVGPPSSTGFFYFVLCLYWGEKKKPTVRQNQFFFLWYRINKYFVLPILLERVAALRDLHLVCGLKFDSRLKEGEYWGSNAQCLFLRQPSLLSACLGMWRLTANGDERIPLIVEKTLLCFK